MIDESLWVNPYHGLELEPGFKEGHRDNENGILFLVEYFFLKYELGSMTAADIAIFETIVKRLRTYKPDGQSRYSGLFDRGEGESLTIPKDKLRTISHDNISAIVSFSAMYGLEWHKHVYEHGKTNLWRFDNVYPESPRWERLWLPRDVIYYSRLGGGWLGKSIAWMFMWYFYLTQVISCARKYKVRPIWYERLWDKIRGRDPGEIRKDFSTSGPLLVFMRLFPLRRRSAIARLVWKICTGLIKFNRKAGWDWVFDYYFKHPEHPNKILAKKLYSSN